MGFKFSRVVLMNNSILSQFFVNSGYKQDRVNASGRVDKNRGKIETVRPFEPQAELPRMAGVINRNQFLKKTGSQGIDKDVNSLAYSGRIVSIFPRGC